MASPKKRRNTARSINVATEGQFSFTALVACARHRQRVDFSTGNRRCYLRIVSANVNGLKSASEKSFFDLPHDRTADVLCLQ